MRGAPPCVKAYEGLHAAALGVAAAPSVRFAVLDVDSTAEAADLATELGLERLPAYIVTADGAEVARLVRTSEREALPDVLSAALDGRLAAAPLSAAPAAAAAAA
jgi:hypothetical protein